MSLEDKLNWERRGEITVKFKELENFLWYLQDKSDDVFQTETKKAVQEYLREIKPNG